MPSKKAIIPQKKTTQKNKNAILFTTTTIYKWRIRKKLKEMEEQRVKQGNMDTPEMIEFYAKI